MIRTAVLLLLLGAACTVPSLDELYEDCDQPLTPEMVAGGPTDGLIGDNRRACSALQVSISYASFQAQCLTLTVVDHEAPSRTDSTQVQVVANVRSDTQTVAVMRRRGWSRDLRLIATTHERSCSGPLVAEQSVDAQVPAEGITEVRMDLRAEDLDNDSYISAEGSLPGTDCDDSNADIHPNAPEVCDGVDNNCRNGEADAPSARSYYPDRDLDGYGDESQEPIPSCIQPANTATQGGDCNDNDASVRPGQAESRCDGQDENCDGVADEAFAVGAACTTAQACPGVNQCNGVSAAVCFSEQQPTEWFVDEDGDAAAGTAVGLSCQPPMADALTSRTDCDESSRYASNAATEVCDRLDNDCDGQVDEDLTACAGTTWAETPDVGGSSVEWRAVAPYGDNRGWLAATDLVVHVSRDSVVPVTNCPGTWQAAWVAIDGRVFLGSGAGRLATVLPSVLNNCEEVAGPGSSGINGLVGFENGNTVRLFAVDSQGRVIRWVYEEGAPSQATPELVTQVTGNLRAIHGVNPETLLAVGSETVNSVERPAAWSAPASGSTWSKESLGSTGTTGPLRAVRVLTPKLAYAAGDGGLFLERSGTTWTAKPLITVGGIGPVDIRAMVAFGRTAIYAATSGTRDVRFFNGMEWTSISVPPRILNALGASGPRDLWGAGGGGTLVRWQPQP
jgi:hypothetical protein